MNNDSIICDPLNRYLEIKVMCSIH